MGVLEANSSFSEQHRGRGVSGCRTATGSLASVFPCFGNVLLTCSHLLHLSHFDPLPSVDFVPPNITISNYRVYLSVFAHDDAATKMIVEGRSPSMRHASRTHLVHLHRLFGRVTLYSNFSFRQANTEHRLRTFLQWCQWSLLQCVSSHSLSVHFLFPLSHIHVDTTSWQVQKTPRRAQT